MLKATQYVKRGPMIVLRAGLDDDDPESWPSLWRGQYGTDLDDEVPNWRGQVGAGRILPPGSGDPATAAAPAPSEDPWQLLSDKQIEYDALFDEAYQIRQERDALRLDLGALRSRLTAAEALLLDIGEAWGDAPQDPDPEGMTERIELIARIYSFIYATPAQP
jgi:hypothetical protein